VHASREIVLRLMHQRIVAPPPEYSHALPLMDQSQNLTQIQQLTAIISCTLLVQTL
jgi:hypothetical protein